MLPEIFGLTKKITMQMKMVCTLVTKHQKADGHSFFGSCLLFSRLMYIQKKVTLESSTNAQPRVKSNSFFCCIDYNNGGCSNHGI